MKSLRSRFIPAFLLICIALTGCASQSGDAGVVVLPKEHRPNIVFILADDLDAKMNTIAYMQNLQQLLVAQGTTLDDFLVTNAVCCPSRTTILRGQYTHSHKVYHNDAPDGGFSKFNEVGDDESTLGVWLQPAGYRTALMGKYLNGYPLPDDRTNIPPGWSEWVSPARKNAYDGYDYVLNETGTLVEYPPDEINYFTDVMSRKAVDFIQRAAADETPFFLYLAPFAPHEPATPALRHRELFQSLTVPYTPSFNEDDMSDKPNNLNVNLPLTDKQISDLHYLYAERVRSMQAVDEMLAALIKTLDATGQLENTYIIFTSDNGFHLGQHRLLAGKNTFYEEDIVVPFIARGPGIPKNREVPGFLAGNVDIAPTIAEWAGVVPPQFVEGRSFAGVLAGATTPPDWRQGYLLEVYVEAGGPDEVSVPFLMAHLDVLGSILGSPSIAPRALAPSTMGLRTARYLYAEHNDGFVEFYDLQSDPYELQNLASTTDEAILAQYSEWLKAYHSCNASECLQIDPGLDETKSVP